MNQADFTQLSSDLQSLVTKIPLHWGAIQNNRVDDKIDMFKINGYSELEKAINSLGESQKNYLRRRWFLWKCSQCDEYLFYSNNNVESNPNPYDKSYDVRINGKYDFDIKGTVIPQAMRQDVQSVLRDPRTMIDFFYDQQSTGRRYDIQNRLFIVHHSFVDPSRELLLRCQWIAKKHIYGRFCERVDEIAFYNTHRVMAGVIFILEYEIGKIGCSIYGL